MFIVKCYFAGKITFHNKHDESSWKVTMVDTGQDTLKGGRIKRLENFLEGEVTLLTYGDGLSDVNINKLLEFHKSHGKMVTFTGVHPGVYTCKGYHFTMRLMKF